MRNYFIDPKCSIPLFEITDRSSAKRCGRLSGYYYSVILSIIFSIIYGVYLFYLKLTQTDNTDDIEKYNQSKKRATTVFICVLILSWICTPILSEYFNTKSWEGYKYQIDKYMKDYSLNREDAVKRLINQRIIAV